MIEDLIERWHRYLAGELPGGLDELLADDVVFYSPVVYTPQEGKVLTKLYLEAAGQMLLGDPSTVGEGPTGGASSGGGFRYTKQAMSDHTALLEFEATVEGTYVNGVDIIRCDDAGRIVEFRVMIRPLQAVNLLHRLMKAMLESTQPPQ